MSTITHFHQMRTNFLKGNVQIIKSMALKRLKSLGE